MRVGRVRGKGKWVKGRVLCFLIPKWTRRIRYEHGNKLESAGREDNADREAGATRRSGELSGPADVKKFDGTEPSGGSFWRLAAEGKTFYTVPENHFNCAVGAHTHNIELAPEREKEAEQTLKMMFDLGYVKPEVRRFRGWRKRRRRLCMRRWEMLMESRMWRYSR